MGKSIGSLVFNFGANLSGFDKALNRAQKRIKKFGKSMQKMGSTMTRNVTLPLLGLGAAALKFGSDLQETDSKFQQVFSSIREEAEKTAKTFQESFGLSELTAKQLLSDTGDLLVGFGFTEEGALDLSSQVNALAVDLASFSNFAGGTEGASKALTKALVGETESAKALGIVIRQGTKEYRERTKTIMKEQGVSILQAKALNNLEIATKQSQKAIGDYARTSGDFANQMRKTKETLIDVAAAFGEQLIPFAQSALERIQKLIEWFSGLSDSTKKTIVVVGLFVGALGPFLIVLGKMATGFAASKLAVAALIRSLGFLKLALLSNPVTAILTGLAIAVGFLVKELGTMDLAVKESEQLYDDLVAKREKLEKLNTAELKQRKLKLEGLLTPLKEELKIARQLEETQAKTITPIPSAGRSMMMMGGEEGTAGAQETSSILQAQLGDEIKKRRVVERQITKYTNSLKIVNDLLGIKKEVEEETRKNGKKGAEEQIEEFSLIEDRYGNMITLTKELMMSWKQSPIEDQFKDMIIWETELTDKQKLLNASMGIFGDIVTQSLTQALDSGEDFFESFVDGVKRAVRALLIQLAVMTAIQMLFGKIPGMGGLKAALTTNLGDIMNVELQHGGLVTGPTTALIGEGAGTSISNPEVVAPLDKLKQFMGGGGQNIVVTGKIVGNDIWLSNAKTQFNRLRTT